jgi:putative membrane protein
MYWNSFCGPASAWLPWHAPLFMMLIGLVVVFSLTRLFAGRKKANGEFISDQALDILQQRYAQGEISEEEYLQRRDNLR